METIELVIYFFVAVVIGSLIVGFIGGWNVQETYSGFQRLFGQEEVSAYEQVTLAQVPGTIIEVWDECGFGALAFNKTISVSDAGNLNKTGLFLTIQEYNLCKSLQSNASGCGTREDVVDFMPIQTPAIIKISCDPALEQLVLT